MGNHPRFEKNVPGPWYTTGGCVACGAPEDEAPELFAGLNDDNYETYFVRQPETPEEAERACNAAKVCCLSTIRYCGTDKEIIRRLGNSPEYCDNTIGWFGRVRPVLPPWL